MKLIIVSKKLPDLVSDSLISELRDIVGADFSYTLIEPKEKSYKVEEIKEFVRRISLKKDSNTSKIVSVITKGDSLSPIVQNSLLKPLEDSDVNLLILVKNPHSLLPTVRSRMQEKHMSISKDEFLTDNKNLKDLDFDAITSLSKLERSEVVKNLESIIESIDSSQIDKVLFYQDAIHKINANCKVEAVLIELIAKIA